MILQAYAAPLDLLPFVSGYLYGHSNFVDKQQKPCIPRGMPAIMVILDGEQSGPVEIIQPQMARMLNCGVFLFGQTTQMWWLNVAVVRAYIIVLKPTALPMLLGESAVDFTDTIIQLDELLPNSQLLVPQLSEQKSQLGQLAVLDTFLRKLFQNKICALSEIEGSIDYILQTQGQLKIEELSIRERISMRTLTRKFTEQVGMSPKQYAKIVRFRSLMHYLFTTPNARWLDVTHRFGYYDQSHFIKEFQYFTGFSPGQYLSIDQNLDAKFINALTKI